MALVEARRDRRIDADGTERRIADRAGAAMLRARMLARELEVRLDAGHPVAPLPIVTGLDAADRAVRRSDELVANSCAPVPASLNAPSVLDLPAA